MENADFNEIAEVINSTLARLMIQGLALSELVRLLSAAQKQEFAENMRSHVSTLMQERANESTPEMDEAVTLQLAALLESAGQPPQRG